MVLLVLSTLYLPCVSDIFYFKTVVLFVLKGFLTGDSRK